MALPQFLRERFARLIAGKSPTDLLFTAPSGALLRNSNFRRDVWNPPSKSADSWELTPLALRHTAASLAVASGTNVKAVQRMLGHKDAAMTLNTYADRLGTTWIGSQSA